MKILVTGGCGFIGINFIKLALKKNFNIFNIDLLTYASIANKKVIKHKNYKFLKLEIGSEKKLFEVVKKFRPNFIVNFAAETHVDKSIDDPIIFFKKNIMSFGLFLKTLKKYYDQCNKNFKLLHISTDEVYGSLKAKEKSFKEKNKYFPNSPYAASKASSDHIARSFNKTFGIPIIISNCSNNYGPFQYPEKLIPLTIVNAINNQRIPIYGNGNQIRDWLFVNDHCNALLKILKHGKIGETYNIGGDNQIKNINLVKKICKYLDQKFARDKSNSFSKLIINVEDRLSHDERYSVNCNKIKKQLKWKAKTSLDSGIKLTIDWYLKNYNWISSNKDTYQKWIKKNYKNRKIFN
jgi:dTDP-glucose 4,6-dehydratase